jgi:hypothetical protein
MGGEIEVQSAVDVETTFRVRMPLPERMKKTEVNTLSGAAS